MYRIFLKSRWHNAPIIKLGLPANGYLLKNWSNSLEDTGDRHNKLNHYKINSLLAPHIIQNIVTKL